MTMTLRQQNSNEARSLRTWIANVAKTERDSWYKIPWARSSHLFFETRARLRRNRAPRKPRHRNPEEIKFKSTKYEEKPIQCRSKAEPVCDFACVFASYLARAQQNANVKNYQKPIHSPPHRPIQATPSDHSSFFTERTTFVLNKHDEAGSNRCRDGHDRRRGRGKSAT